MQELLITGSSESQGGRFIGEALGEPGDKMGRSRTGLQPCGGLNFLSFLSVLVSMQGKVLFSGISFEELIQI